MPPIRRSKRRLRLCEQGGDGCEALVYEPVNESTLNGFGNGIIETKDKVYEPVKESTLNGFGNGIIETKDKVHPKPVLVESTPNRNTDNLRSRMEVDTAELSPIVASSPVSKRRRMEREESAASDKSLKAINIAEQMRETYETYAFRPARARRRPRPSKKKAAQQHSAQLKEFLDKMNSEFAKIETVELNIMEVSPSESLREI